MQHMYIIKDYLLLKNGILSFATTQIDFDGIILSELSQRKTNISSYSYVKSEK